jgi:hypothetical protein
MLLFAISEAGWTVAPNRRYVWLSWYALDGKRRLDPMGLRLSFYALVFMVGFVMAGLALISQGSQSQFPGQASAVAATLATDNGNNGVGPIAAGPVAAADVPSSGSGCAPAGSDTTIASADGRITVHVFPTMSRNVQFTIVTPVEPTIVPASPGQRVGALLFQVTASECGGGAIAPLPAEVNLGVRYSDADVGSLNEANFKLAWLDPADNTWKPLQKQAPDPAANYVSATIMNTGFFVVYQ